MSFKIPTLFYFLFLIMISCTSSKKVKPPPAVEPPSHGIPRGAVQINAEIISSNERIDCFICYLHVKEVLGYGPTAPSLPADSKIEVLIPKSLIEKDKYGDITSGKRINLIIVRRRVVGKSESSIKWEAIRLKI